MKKKKKKLKSGKKKKGLLDVETLAKKVSKKSKLRTPINPDDLDVVKHIKKQLKKEGVDIEHVLTRNQRKLSAGVRGKLYICAVTEDCPSEYVTAGGVDFPKFIQPIDRRSKRSRAVSRRVSSRPQRLKRNWLNRAQIKRILLSAYNKELPITVPTGEMNDMNQPMYTVDHIPMIYFLVLQETSEKASDPEIIKPVIKRPKSVRNIVSQSLTVADLEEQSKAKRVKKVKGRTVVTRDIEQSKFAMPV